MTEEQGKRTAPSVGDAAPDMLLLTTAGRSVRLSELWQARPLLLLLKRHLG